MSSDNSFNIVGLVLGVLGLGTFQILVLIIRSLLPKYRLVSLEEAYATAYGMFECGLSESLFLDDEVEDLREKLKSIRIDMNTLQSEVAGYRNVWQHFIAMLSSISRDANTISVRIQEACAEIASSSQRGRLRLQDNGLPYKPCMFPFAASISNAFFVPKTMVVEERIPHTPLDSHNNATSTSSASVDMSETHTPPHPARSSPRRNSASSLSTTATIAAMDDPQDGALAKFDNSLHASNHVASDREAAAGGPLCPSDVSLHHQSGIDSITMITKFCTDFQSQIDHMQFLLSLVHSENLLQSDKSGEVDIEGLQESLTTSKAQLSSLSKLWTRPETKPLLPS